MSQLIDRTGIFKARPVSWSVRRTENSKSVAINFRFQILDMLIDGAWHDWLQYGEHHVFGDWYIVKKDGGVNQKPIEQLSASLGWKGSLIQVSAEPPPDCVVQIRVESEEYQGKTRIKATWMNPENFQPESRGEDESSVRDLDAQFGSQLRAVASASPKPSTKPSPPRSTKASNAEAAASVGPDFPNTDPDGDDWVPPELREEDSRSRQ